MRKNKAMKCLIRGNFLEMCWGKLDYMLACLSRKIIYSLPVEKENKVFFMTYDFKFSDNQAYIAKEFLNRKAPVKLIWAVKDKATPMPKGIRKVIYRSYNMFEEMNTAKIWVDNALNCVWDDMPKQKDQYYFNTWHGSMGIKRLSGSGTWLHRAHRCQKRTDYCITNSTFEEGVFDETFWKGVPCLKYGHARNDLLFDEIQGIRMHNKVCKALKIPASRKLFLYAPTFRDDGDMSFLSMDYHAVQQALEEKFGGQWVVLVRLHFKNRAHSKIVKYDNRVINASGYPDMQELLAAVDMGCTDYSSWAYDYVLTHRPMMLYAPDIQKYNGSRGFYYPLEETPFPIARDTEELLGKIAAFDEEQYHADCEKFLQARGCYEEGHAAERIVDKMLELMGITDCPHVEKEPPKDPNEIEYLTSYKDKDEIEYLEAEDARADTLVNEEDGSEDGTEKERAEV